MPSVHAGYMTARLVTVSGRVQGVGYRWFVREYAIAAGVTGWVRNRRDGSVEAALHGAPDAIDTVIAAMRTGPAGSSVVSVREEPIADTVLEGFEIRPTG